MPDTELLAHPTDLRQGPRTVVRRCGWTCLINGEQLRECIVWDQSAAGACLVADDAEEIPDDFYIFMSRDFTSRRHCRAVWRTEKFIGVRFVD